MLGFELTCRCQTVINWDNMIELCTQLKAVNHERKRLAKHAVKSDRIRRTHKKQHEFKLIRIAVRWEHLATHRGQSLPGRRRRCQDHTPKSQERMQLRYPKQAKHDPNQVREIGIREA